MLDLVGKKFGLLTVVKKDHDQNLWLCRCECGNQIAVAASQLTGSNGHITSCGCSDPIIIAGQQFSNLTAMEPREKKSWLCQCKCGNTIVVSARDLSSGHVRHCGCLRPSKPWRPMEAQGVIYDSNPNAIDLIKHKINTAQKQVEEMRRANAYYRKHKSMINYIPLDPTQKIDYQSGHGAPYCNLDISKLTAEIKRLSNRIAIINESRAIPARPEKTVNGVRIVEDKFEMQIFLFLSISDSIKYTALFKKYKFRLVPEKNQFAANRVWFRAFTRDGLTALDKLVSELNSPLVI